jgi:hypothetical protein
MYRRSLFTAESNKKSRKKDGRALLCPLFIFVLKALQINYYGGYLL